MNRTRLVIVLLLVIVIVGVAVALVTLNSPAPEQTTTAGNDTTTQQISQPIIDSTPEPTITPIPMAEIVIAVQDIPRGVRVDANTIALVPWPVDAVPVNAITNTEDIIGLIARTDIYREQPILGNLVVPDFQSLSTIGSDAALVTPPNRLLVAVPMNRLTSVAYALQPGDRVDVIASLLFVDVDQTFQSIEPNTFSLLSQDEAGNLAFGTGLRGAFDTRLIPTTGSVPVLVQPSEEPRPRLSVQRTVQDALVIWVGNFPDNGKLFVPAATPTPENPTPTPEGAVSGTEVAPTPVLITRDIVTLAVSPQDAVVLTWYVEAKIPFTFALRSAATTTLPQTDAVTLDYIMGRFNILVPERFNYAIEPAIRTIRSLEAGDQITLQSE